ncbi:MAG: hypothetical protein M1833_002872 [Piccolia ochrophora]|nr:MAG: hypothetical protein M1833_002872 [Piccolia ochrophora]
MASIPNQWYLRQVASSSSKACFICYKPTPSVLITPDSKVTPVVSCVSTPCSDLPKTGVSGSQRIVDLEADSSKDFFYVCNGHLSDRGFCTPVINEEAAKKSVQEAKDSEIEKVKKEYEEKQRKKEAKLKKAKEDDKGEDKDLKDDKKEKGSDGKETEKEAEPADAESSQSPAEKPRVFTLHKNFYQMRLDRLRAAEISRRNRDRFKNPVSFPSVPQDQL